MFKVPFVFKLGKFMGTLAALIIVTLMICVLLTIIALTAKFLVWLFI